MILRTAHKLVDNIDRWRDKRRGIHDVLQNINMDITKKQKRILICYLSYRKVENMLSKGVTHSNLLEFVQIIKTFINQGFVIDVCAHDSEEGFNHIRNIKYDYIFGMGETYRRACRCNPDAFRIEYFTENPYWFSYQQEKERIDYFYKRHGKKLVLERTGRYYLDGDEENADTIICMSNPERFNQVNVPIHRILPSALRNENFVLETDDVSQKSFLVLGTEGLIHKGLDIVVEIFMEHQEWGLVVCGRGFKESCRKLGYSLTSNIKDMGYVDIQSETFLDICRCCRFVILPSCSEGASTAIETAMIHGVIPIVMEHMVYDEPRENFLLVEKGTKEEIESVIKQAMMMDQNAIINMSKKIYDYANGAYSIQNYTRRFQQIIESMVEKNEGCIS